MVELTPREALSGICGSVSLASWIFLLIPQLIENYRSQSAKGISLAFLTVWLLGDIANFSGAVWAGLVPTVIALAIYFCFADVVLIAQCLYYNIRNARRRRARAESSGSTDGANGHVVDADERQPLLRTLSGDNIGLPGSRRRSSTASAKRRDSSALGSLPTITEDDGESSGRTWMKNGISIVLVCVVGALGWLIAWKAGVWVPTPLDNGAEAGDEPVGAEILGYLSAVAYLGARIPQIIKNYREKSCEGLSLLFFMLSLLGNATYGAQILSHSTETRYVITNLPWLIGSLGTMVEDVIIFVQFHLYKNMNGPGSSLIIE